MSTIAAIATLIVALITVVIALTGTIRWVWKQAQNQSTQTQAIQQNTKATEGLSASFKVYTDKADGHILDHEKRLTAVEVGMAALLARMNDFIASITNIRK